MKSALKVIAMLIISATMLLGMENVAVFDTEEKPTQVITTQKPTQKPTFVIKGAERESFDVLKGKYKDIVGYINIPETSVDDVVVQTDNNEYYLRRSPSGEYRYKGCYFVDYRCDMENLSQNTTIYGHNLYTTDVMFGQLTKYKKLDFYKKSPSIKFDILSENAEWKIFAVFLTNVKKEDGAVFDYRQPNYDTQEEFLHFVERSKRRSIIDTPVDVKANDKILTLSTCTYEINNDWRLVVMGRKVRDGENPAVDVSKAQYNSNPLYPDRWYRKFGGKQPQYDDEP